MDRTFFDVHMHAMDLSVSLGGREAFASCAKGKALFFLNRTRKES